MYVFKIGVLDKDNPAKCIIPTKAAFEKLEEKIDKLELDEPYIIWGPDLEVDYIGGKEPEDGTLGKAICEKLNVDYLEVERIKERN